MKYIRVRTDSQKTKHFDAQIRLAEEQSIYKIFSSKAAAEKYVRQTLVAPDQGKLLHHYEQKSFEELARIFLNEVAINYSSANEQSTVYIIIRIVKDLPPSNFSKL